MQLTRNSNLVILADKILKRIVSPKRKGVGVEDVQKIEIPDNLRFWIDKYKKIGGRDDFVWKLFYKIDLDIDYFPTEEKFKERLIECRFLIAVIVVVIDDLADQDQDTNFLDVFLELFSQGTVPERISANKTEIEILNYTQEIFTRVKNLLKGAPQYQNLKDIFLFDFRQMINAMQYSNLINKNLFLINKTEYWIYSPQTMQFAISGLVDMMFVPSVDYSKVGEVRKILWSAQKMARIGNCLNTWEREIKNNDFTSGVFAYAINDGIIAYDDLNKKKLDQIVKKIKNSNVEKEMLREWKSNYRQISKCKTKAINTRKILDYLEHLLALERISKNYK